METVPIPGGTLVEKAFPRVDYADAYRTPAVGTAPELARRMLAGRSRMGGRLFCIRDALVRPFGIRPAHRGSSVVRIEAGARAGPFQCSGSATRRSSSARTTATWITASPCWPAIARRR